MFKYRLAYKLGYPSVSKMCDEITNREMAYWIAAFQLGIDNDSWSQTGTIAATIHNEITSALYSYAGKRMPKKHIQSASHYNPFHVKKTKKVNRGSIARFVALAKKVYRGDDR